MRLLKGNMRDMILLKEIKSNPPLIVLSTKNSGWAALHRR
jgi:hypothetical protein